VALESESEGDLRRCFLIGDVTERRQMDAEIAQGRKLRAVGELVGGIAHEFNNLLTPILLNAEAIGFDLPAESPLQDDLGVIRQAAERATELTRRLLNFGRRSDSRAEAVGLIAMVSNMFQLLAPTIDRRIRLESELPAELAPLFLNPTDLHQILLNLLLNARDTLMEKLAGATAEDWAPRIWVSAQGFGPDAKPVVGENRRGSPLAWQRLTVRDNGLGMPPAVLERIFEPFFTTKEVGKGTGLGLATVWHLATALGGSVEVESAPGLGTAFHVWLPVWPVPAPVALPVDGAPVQRRAGQGVRILLVEDDDLVARTVLAALRLLGHETKHIAHGAEGWEHLRASLDRYHLLICDLNMPGLSGVELIRRAREAKFGGTILVMSGRLTDEDTQALRRCRVERIIAKPFTIAAFQAAVAACPAQGK
jgi:two-component system, cell cycle sensor histidine kinase and response regulator CckA